MANADIDCVVVGAGVVGLAIAVELARRGTELLLLEAESRPGDGISSRNSGVIHAGLYYPPGSLKAQLCARGRDALYAYAERRGIPCRRLGKLIVATRKVELPALQQLLTRGRSNGVALEWLDAGAALALEPQLRCIAAIHSPDSGIIDTAELVMALAGDLQQAGGELLCHASVTRVGRPGTLFEVEAASGDRLTCRRLVNAAGLGATALAAATEGMAAARVPRLWYGAGHYYQAGRVPFSRLIYPLPIPGALGVHLGFDLAGKARFGPDLRFIDRVDYSFDDSRRATFANAIREWWPALRDEDLAPDFVGIRPKLVGPGEHNPDFVVQTAAEHGIEGLVNLFGIESPGLTATLALGEHVADLVCRP
ncbi:MAG TPA: NAD(P)/FAD-dependent oxidoreductase [Gammaproteobacteria bacterium]|nr:NAD(P)/FAD-dependent oxidoreductase [Gammaproteobacteria bacterium]